MFNIGFNIGLLALFVIIIILISHWLGQQAYNWLPTPATAEAVPVGELFSFLVTLGAIVFLLVAGVILYSIFFYRADPADTSDGPSIRGNLKIEIIWTVIPVLLVLWIAGYSASIYQRMDTTGHMDIVHLHTPLEIESEVDAQQVNSSAQPIENIEVLAKQWYWLFRYPAQNIISPALHLPVNQRVHLIMKSDRVLHGFYVPNFRIKQDIFPNRIIELNFTPTRIGKYKLHDSQFSGTYFATMTADVYIDSPENYHQWLAQLTVSQPNIPPNQAEFEHMRPKQTPLQQNWPTIPPAKSHCYKYDKLTHC